MNVIGLLRKWLMDRTPDMPSELLRRGATSSQRLLGSVISDREAAELRALLEMPRNGGERVPTVFLPGFMGSYLASTSGIGATLWISTTLLANGQLNLLDLADDGITDLSPDVEIHPVGIDRLSYLKTVIGLAHATRLYEFPYDWRHAVERTARRLRQAITRWSRNEPDRKFVLVGHSMGGMVARTYAALWPDECARNVSRIVMIGSPMRGAATPAMSFAAKARTAGLIYRLNPANDVIRFVTSMPSSYQLLPPPRDCWDLDRPYPYDWNTYDATAWAIPGMRQDWLDHAKAWYRKLFAAPEVVPLTQIVGCHQRTMTDVRRGSGDGWSSVETLYGPDGGDDSVPAWSTERQGVPTFFIQEHHQLLPANSQVVQAVVNLTHDEAPALPISPPEPRGVLSRIETAPLMKQAAALRKHIESGEVTRDDLISLLLHRE